MRRNNIQMMLQEIKKKEIYKEVMPKWLSLVGDFYKMGIMVKDLAMQQSQVPSANPDDGLKVVLPYIGQGIERAIDLWYETDIKLSALKNEERIKKLREKIAKQESQQKQKGLMKLEEYDKMIKRIEEAEIEEEQSESEED